MKIHTLAERTGLSASAIRFYEKQGLLDSRHVRRGANNYRDYSEAAVRHLEMIKKVQSVGFTLSELKEVVQAEEANALRLCQRKSSFFAISWWRSRGKKRSWSRFRRIFTGCWPTNWH
ncbi:MerR family transcriptional regulator [Paenibacillus sp. P26]|nr:MerR family transcriptional regulator [Paenibacillus sp. P26]